MTRRTVSRDEWIVALAWAGGAILVWAGRAFLPGLAAMGPGCPFHALTGFPCLGCGTTRAALLLAAGHPVAAFLMNPLAALALSALWLGGLLAPVWLALRLPMPRIPARLAMSARAGVIVLLLANWCFLVARGI